MSETEPLSDEVKYFIVQKLACFGTPSEVAKDVKDEFGIVITRQRVQLYDPTKKAGADLGAELKAIFEATRAALIEGTAEVAASHKMVRLQWLNDMIVTAKASRNLVLAAQLIEQAAKESGGAYTNKHQLEHTGKDGKDIPASAPAQVMIIALPDNGRG